MENRVCECKAEPSPNPDWREGGLGQGRGAAVAWEGEEVRRKLCNWEARIPPPGLGRWGKRSLRRRGGFERLTPQVDKSSRRLYR